MTREDDVDRVLDELLPAGGGADLPPLEPPPGLLERTLAAREALLRPESPAGSARRPAVGSIAS